MALRATAVIFVAALAFVSLASAQDSIAPVNGGLSEIDHPEWRSSATGGIDPALLQALMRHLSERYDLPEPRTPPGIMFMSPDELLAHLAEAEGLSVGSMTERDVVALYDTRTGTILLDHSWRGDDPVERSVLVHELIHHLQSAAERRYACAQAREKEAYRAQSDWLARSGQDLASVFDIDMMMMLVLTNCGI